MDIQEKRNVTKKVEIDIITKNVKLFYLVESDIKLNEISFTVTTEKAISFNLVDTDIGFHRDAVIQLEQDVTIEHEKKIAQIYKNVKVLQELGFIEIELS